MSVRPIKSSRISSLLVSKIDQVPQLLFIGAVCRSLPCSLSRLKRRPRAPLHPSDLRLVLSIRVSLHRAQIRGML